ncbi:MAG: RidA family protein [Candidatus Eremiobacteraeota bacterium]|nr:RidA family protein [Candidatus Eremiobacteraeota bacterium]
MDIEPIFAESAPKAFGPYSHAIRANGVIYVSGQVPVDPQTSVLVEGGIREQTRQVFKNLQAILEAAGSSLQRVTKLTLFLSDWNDFAAMNEVCAEVLQAPYPARSTIQNSRPMGALVGADAIAV